jgi:hypothetical protein
LSKGLNYIEQHRTKLDKIRPYETFYLSRLPPFLVKQLSVYGGYIIYQNDIQCQISPSIQKTADLDSGFEKFLGFDFFSAAVVGFFVGEGKRGLNFQMAAGDTEFFTRFFRAHA